MKYIVLLYAAEGAWPPDEHRVALAESVQLCHELHARGQYCDAAPLQPPSTAVRVRVRGGERLVTDGPFAETKEHLGGYFVIDVASREEAVAVAARIPGARRGTAEVRPIHEWPAGSGGSS
ncbi:MAG: YciI family protein [Pirellulaceae bacterium]